MAVLSHCLWLVDKAEEAATYYAAHLPGAAVAHVARKPSGDVVLVQMTIAGASYTMMNGADQAPNSGYSITLSCDDQEEIDRLWDALVDGGQPKRCGWLVDRFGVTWQIQPKHIGSLLFSGDAEADRRVMAAMLTMQKMDLAALEAAARG